MRNSLSDRASAKILKFIVFFVIWVVFYCAQTQLSFLVKGRFLFNAVLAYVMISFGLLIRKATRRPFAAAIASVAIYVVICLGMDSISQYVPFLTAARITSLIYLAGVLLIAFDLSVIIREFA